jgi:hypothetical protein
MMPTEMQLHLSTLLQLGYAVKLDNSSEEIKAALPAVREALEEFGFMEEIDTDEDGNMWLRLTDDLSREFRMARHDAAGGGA